jgi:hypothetical protein
MSVRNKLLHLEADGALELINLGLHALVVAERAGELAGLVETGTKDLGDVLDDGRGGKESVVLGGCDRDSAMCSHGN